MSIYTGVQAFSDMIKEETGGEIISITLSLKGYNGVLSFLGKIDFREGKTIKNIQEIKINGIRIEKEDNADS